MFNFFKRKKDFFPTTAFSTSTLYMRRERELGHFSKQKSLVKRLVFLFFPLAVKRLFFHSFLAPFVFLGFNLLGLGSICIETIIYAGCMAANPNLVDPGI